VAQKWADQCADVDYKDDYKRKDPHLFHDPHPQRKVGTRRKYQKQILTLIVFQPTSVTGKGWVRTLLVILHQEKRASSMPPN
jgi:hypothetical protein